MGDFGKHVHFIGIGGIGMSGLARILLGFGVKCSGSDVARSQVVQDLEALGATVYLGHAAENLTDDVDTVVYSSAIKAGNEELREAYERQINVIGRAELLAQVMTQKCSIAVAGAHGKTSTTAMIGTMLKYNGLEPTIIVGGQMPYIGANACWGSGEYLVAEADESDGSFLQLMPKIAVVNNIENDHLDHYGTMENLIDAFYQFVAQVPDDGFVVLGIDNAINAQLALDSDRDCLTYGVNNPAADVQARDIRYQGFGSVCEIFYRNEQLGTLHLPVPGQYNVENALAAVCIGLRLGLDFAAMNDGLGAFTGTGRRFDKLGQNADGTIVVVDDYAHHPTEIKSALSAAANLPFKRVIGVFQPHRYSRTQLLAEEFGASFDVCDLVIINAIYGAFEPPIEGVSGQLIVDAILRRSNKPVYYAKEAQDVVSLLLEHVQQGDLVMIMGAGNIRRAGEIFAASL